jgi:heme exporter protein A
MTNHPLAIEVRGLTKRFGRRLVLDAVDLQIERGESVVLTGANGAGKSTLLRTMAALIRPNSGEVLWFGQPAAREDRGLIGMVAHEHRLYPNFTLRENLVFAARMCDVARPHESAERMLETVALAAHAERMPPVLSKGMRQRLSLARALIHEPAILLLDEPFDGLDAAGEAWLMSLFDALRNQGRTLCFVLHDVRKTDALADRVLRLEEGNVRHIAARARAA